MFLEYLVPWLLNLIWVLINRMDSFGMILKVMVDDLKLKTATPASSHGIKMIGNSGAANEK